MTPEPVIGIDLGTTNSAVAVCRDGTVEILTEHGSPLLSSCVGFTPAGDLLIGEPARNQLLLHPDLTVRSIKRKMGSGETIRLGEREYSPQEISAMILRELKLRAERALGEPVSKAVITVPAYFSDVQRQATREAGAIAGLDVLRIINEPTAACLAYEARENRDGHTVMAFDFGGGTFDVSVVTLQGDLVEVVASHGDTQLGGDDIDEDILNTLIGELPEDAQAGARANAKTINRLRQSAETAKIQLSDAPYAKILEDNLDVGDEPPQHLRTEFSRESLDALIEPILARTMTSVRHALDAADKTRKDIDEVLLVGGSTRIPAVAEMLHREMGREPRVDLHPELAVVYGAGVMAARLMGTQDQRILIDITPYTFGTSAVGMSNGLPIRHLYCPIIHSGTPLPVTKSRVFYTVADGQETVDVTIFEGEHQDARKNILIGRFLVEGLDPDAPDNSPIILAMDLDLDGILRVTATEKETGLSKNIVIDRALEKLSDQAIQEAQREIAEIFGDDIGAPPASADEPLGGPMEHAEGETMAPAEEGDAIRTGRRVLRRLHHAKDAMDGVDRQDADQLEQGLHAALEDGDEQTVEQLCAEIDDLLFYVESDG